MSDLDPDSAPGEGHEPDPTRRPDGPLDGPAARIVAFGVFLLCVAALAWIHRDDLFPPEPATASRDDPVARCLAPRLADIEQMLDDRVIDDARATLFKSRAEALCRAQAGGGNPPPAPK